MQMTLHGVLPPPALFSGVDIIQTNQNFVVRSNCCSYMGGEKLIWGGDVKVLLEGEKGGGWIYLYKSILAVNQKYLSTFLWCSRELLFFESVWKSPTRCSILKRFHLPIYFTRSPPNAINLPVRQNNYQNQNYLPRTYQQKP